MGCTASRVANEDTVRRCKERRRLMKEAVYSRHHLAAAHSDYVRSLRETAAALTRFASFQSLSVSDQTPPVVLPPSAPPSLPKPLTSSAASNSTPTPPPPLGPTQYRQFHRHHHQQQQQQQAAQQKDQYHFFPPSPTATLKSEKLPPIRPGKPSVASTPARSAKKTYEFPHAAAGANSTYSATPSQSSSTWDWEKFYPPSPPDSDYFDRLDQERREKEEQERQSLQQRLQRQFQDHHLPEEDGGSSGDDEVEEEEEREEAHCSDWGDHYSRTSSSDAAADDEDGAEERSEGINTGTYYYGSAPTTASVDHNRHIGRGAPPSELGSASFGRSGRKERWHPEDVETISSFDREESASAVAPAPDMRLVLRHRDLKEIVAAIEENFLKAAAAGAGVANLLETGPEQLDRSFRQLKKTVYHSTGVLSNLSSSFSSKPPLAIKYQLDTAALADPGREKCHSSTLERLLAWEKKLYEEVKAREGVKIEHEKKLAALQYQEHKGKDDLKLAKLKASIQRLQSLILVTSEAVTTTSTAIIKVRDEELAPQLVEVCYGLMNMWRSMNQFHEVQNHIVQQVRGLVKYNASLESTSDLHRQATRDLESAVSDWHSSFTRLVKFHHDYIHALHEWLKLTLFQVTDEPATKDPYSSLVSSELTAFCDGWKQAVDAVPGTVPAEALKSFITVVHTIYQKQAEELKVKKRVESYSKDLEKKSIALKAIEKKFYRSYSTVGIALPGQGNDVNGQVIDARDPLAEKKSEIAALRKRVEEEMGRHTNSIAATRHTTLNNIQTGLPGVFQAMTGFSGLLTEALAGVCRRAGPGPHH